MRVILDINIDGYETGEAHKKAVIAFIDSLGSAAIDITFEGILPDEEMTDV